MDTKERHIAENEGKEKREWREESLNQEAQSLLANGKKRKRAGTTKTNNLWLWFGVLILITILLWWLWSIGTFEDLIGYING